MLSGTGMGRVKDVSQRKWYWAHFEELTLVQTQSELCHEAKAGQVPTMSGAGTSRPGWDWKIDKLADSPPAHCLTGWLAIWVSISFSTLSSQRTPVWRAGVWSAGHLPDADVGAPTVPRGRTGHRLLLERPGGRLWAMETGHSRPRLWHPPEGESLPLHPLMKDGPALSLPCHRIWQDYRTPKLQRPSEITALT